MKGEGKREGEGEREREGVHTGGGRGYIPLLDPTRASNDVWLRDRMGDTPVGHSITPWHRITPHGIVLPRGKVAIAEDPIKWHH